LELEMEISRGYLLTAEIAEPTLQRTALQKPQDTRTPTMRVQANRVQAGGEE
jgi:hypothetical protein